MTELITDVYLLEILKKNNFNQTASARFLANESNPENYEKFRYHISKRIALCEFINEANERHKAEKAKTSFDKLHPLIKQQFCKHRNKGIELQSLTPGTHVLIHFICSKCEEPFSSKVKDLQHNLERAENKNVTGCPYCANKAVNLTNSFAACYPELAKHWDYEKNNGKKPFNVLPGSGEKFWFTCKFGHSFDSLLYNITHKKRGRWCPHCKLQGTSYLEIILYFELQYVFGDFVIWNKISKIAKKTYGFECDILLIHPLEGKICIELDSSYHISQESIDRDRKKNQALERLGIKIHRLRNDKLIKLSSEDDFFNDNQDYKSIVSTLFLSLERQFKFSKDEIEKIRAYVAAPNLINLEKIKDCHNYLLEHSSYDDKFLDARPDLEKYWNIEKNLPYSPSSFSRGSHFPAYWKCPDCNSEDQIIVREMVKRKNPCTPCYEKNRKIVEYQDSISSRFPEVLKLWDWEKNQKLGLDPAQINPWSEIEAFWICPFGHPFSASIKSISDTNKSGNSGCPACKYNQNLIDLDGTYVSVAGLVKKIKLESKKNVLHLNSTLSLVKSGFEALHCRAFAILSRVDKLAADLTTKNDPITQLEQYLKKSILSIFSERIEPELQRLERAIKQCNGNVSRAEKLLGLRKSYIHDFCRKRGIKIPK